jgi:two-component system chemotaxis response regulator CheY
MLTELHIDTREAENGAAALESCAQQMPDIVLLDWNMPVLDGIGFLKQLRAMPEVAQPKVLFCTTESEMSRIMQAMSEGADEYIMKPFDDQILESKLRLVGAI